jgi:hypothetical protein
MADFVSDLTVRARALPPEERAQLAEVLPSTLDPSPGEVDAACVSKGLPLLGRTSRSR